MMILVMHVTDGTRIAVNADNISFIAEPTDTEAALGTGAGIAFCDDTDAVIRVRESFDEILAAYIEAGQMKEVRR